MITNLTEQEIHEQYYHEIFKHFEEEPYAQFLGIKLQELGLGTATAELEIKNHMLNSHGTVHGAIIFALADYVFAAHATRTEKPLLDYRLRLTLWLLA